MPLLRPAPGNADPAIDCFEQDFLTLINQYRAENDRTPLQLNAQLDAAADWMSIDLGTHDYFSHIDSLGRDPGQRARDYGYYGGVGENIAGGTPLSSAQAVFDAWKNSPGHNANMLGSSYRVIGIGRAAVPGSPYGTYWTTDFGLTSNGPGDPPPNITCGATPRVTATPTPPSTSTPSPTRAPTPSPTPTPTPTPTPSPTPAPTPTPTPGMPVGDVNCDSEVTSGDALQILRSVAGMDRPGDCRMSADLDCNGQITSVDALDVLLYVVSAPYPVSPGCPPIGK